MKKILTIILSMIMIFALSIPAFAADSSEKQSSEVREYLSTHYVAFTETEHELEKELSPYISSTSIEIEMGKDPSDGQPNQNLIADIDTAVIRTDIMIMTKNSIGADIWLKSYDGVLFKKVEGTARLYVNGKYITSGDFEADPLLAVSTLQAGVLLEYSDGFDIGDRVSVYFDGSFDTLKHGSKDIYQVVNMTVNEL